MFQHNHLNTLFLPNSPNDVHQYENHLQMNINVFSFFDNESLARHPLVIRRKTYERVAHLLYLK